MLKRLTIHHFLMFSLGPIPLSKDQNMETKPQKKWISQVIFGSKLSSLQSISIASCIHWYQCEQMCDAENTW